MATIYALAPELLLAIFAKLPDPILASHVCHSWRLFALADTRLWASPTLIISPATTAAQMSSFALHLTRSGAQPLSATLAANLFDPPLTFTLDATCLLLRHADRWDTLTLALPAGFFDVLCAGVASHSRTHALPLRKLSLTLGGWRGDRGAFVTAALFARTPALRTLAWSNHREWGAWDKPFASGVACAEMRVAWRGLTALVLDTQIDLDGALDVLVHADALQFLKLAHFSEAPEGVVLTMGENGVPLRERYSFAAPLLLPHLRTLHTFSLTLDAALPDLLNCIVCPALIDLSISLGSTPNSVDFAASCPIAGSAVRTLIGRSAHSDSYTQEHARGLTSLILENTGISFEQLVDCLSYASTTLERLEVYESEQRGPTCVNDALLDALSVRYVASGANGGHQHNSAPEVAVLCRGLHTLVLRRVVVCADGALARALRSRIAHEAQSKEAQASEEGKLNEPKVAVARLRHVDVVFLKYQQCLNASDIAYLRSEACTNDNCFK